MSKHTLNSRTKIQAFKSALLIPTVLTSDFHSTNLYLFSRHHILTNSVAPFSVYKRTHNPQVTRQVARKSSRPKSRRPKPESCCPKFIVMSPEILCHTAFIWAFIPVSSAEMKFDHASEPFSATIAAFDSIVSAKLVSTKPATVWQ